MLINKHISTITICIVMIFLGACAPGQIVDPIPLPEESAPEVQPSLTEGSPVPTDTGAPPTGPSEPEVPSPTQLPMDPTMESMIELSKFDLSEHLAIPVEEITLISAKAVDWSDSSLGCPQPGMMYAQVITPGYKISLLANGISYEYHTDTGKNIILCAENVDSVESPCPTLPPMDPKMVKMINLSKEDLSEHLDIPQEEIILNSVEAVDWSDSSLGCPQPGMMYAQVITPGYKISLLVNGIGYEFHTDTGKNIILCAENVDSVEYPCPTLLPMDPKMEKMINLSKDDLSEHLDIPVGEITLISAEAVDWNDSSLGCPQPGMMYAQVITPGYQIELGAGEENYNYHTDRLKNIILCMEND